MMTSMPNVWLPEIGFHISQYLDNNDISCSLRLVDKATRKLFIDRVVVRISQPVPHHAFRHHWSKPSSIRPLNFTERRKLLALTAASGSLPNLQVAVDHSGCDLTACVEWLETNGTTDPMAAAAAAGHIHVCVWLNQHGCPLHHQQLVVAAHAGRQDACTWLLGCGCPWDVKAVYEAFRGGHPDLGNWLMTWRPTEGDWIYAGMLLEGAAEGCNLADFQRLFWWLHQRAKGPLRTAVLAFAASSPLPDWQAKVEWLEQQGCPRTPEACCDTAQCPDAVERLQWLLARGYTADQKTVEVAARKGNVAALRFLLLEGGGIQADKGEAARSAARAGHLAALKLLHAHGWMASPRVCIASVAVTALQGGHLPVLAWLEEAAGLTAEQLQWAVSKQCNVATHWVSGYLQLLHWLFERGCAISMTNLSAVVESGNVMVLEWLVAQGYRFPESTKMGISYDGYELPMRQGDLAMLRCLHQLGCPWGPDVKVFSQWECPPGVQAWLDEVGLPFEVVSEEEHARRWREARRE